MCTAIKPRTSEEREGKKFAVLHSEERLLSVSPFIPECYLVKYLIKFREVCPYRERVCGKIIPFRRLFGSDGLLALLRQQTWLYQTLSPHANTRPGQIRFKLPALYAEQ